jgi:uncharacterized secreted protein with C-terminal beta-propeller domain
MSGLLGCLLGAWACSDNPDAPSPVEETIGGDGESEFVSSPAGGSAGRSAGDALSGAAEIAPGDPAAANGNAVDQDTNAGADRAISEADILQLSGDRLYALSRYSGLTVIDASNPSRLRVEGVYRSAAEPFEMYVEDGLVYAMFNGWYTYSCDDAGFCTWQTEARVQAIDARNPQNIQVLADLEVPGYIADSRRVGDIMYLATEQWGSCWGCEAESNTTITSFNVSNPARFEQLDQLRLPSAGDYGGSRSISVTNQRIYIGGYDYDADVDYTLMPGTIRVVDISDPGGALEQGASFAIAGPIQSRWQMDEFDGVFRVISQPGGWGGERPPVVQTFTVNSSTEIVPAGSLTIELPRPREVLQSVRFDGTRAYAITAEQQDPLFTFDLSNPAAPLQLGELEMPGWVYHMEPRGNRIYALGNDPQHPDGSLHVSLFDVTDLRNPILLSRVAFGGDWGSFAEGQNQIHKAFNILPEQGLILVPFSGGSYDEATCEYDYGSGIQLVDFTDTTLTRRGVAPQVGAARRALLHRDHLFGIGDNAVQTFDISNRDAPVETGQLDVARNVSTVRVLGDHLLRFGSDWMTNQTILDMTPVSQASSAEPQAEIDLSELFGADQWSCNGSAYWGGQVFTRGDYAYVPRYSYSYDRGGMGGSQQQLTFYIVDLSDRSAPRVAGSFAVDPASSHGDPNSYSYITGVIQTDDALLVGRSVGNYGYNYNTGAITSYPRFYYDVLELSDPEAPTVASRFEVPAEAASYGWGRWAVAGCMLDMGWGWYGGGESAQLTDGNLVVSQHAEPVPGTNGSQVKYYLDRIDVSDPYAPQMLPKVNIPGTAIRFDGDTGTLVTIDYQESREAANSWGECYTKGYYGYSQNEYGTGCTVVRRSLNALRIEGERAVRTAQVLLDRETRAGNIAVSDDRIFYTTSDFPTYTAYAAPEAGGTRPTVEMKPVMLETLRIGDGTLTRLPAQELRQMPAGAGYYSQLYARDERVFEIFDSTVNVFDTVDPSNITRISRELPGWGCSSLEVSSDAAYCAVGQRGVEVIDLSGMR